MTSNLAVFIAPTIVQPKLRDGLSLYTKDKIRKSRQDLDDNRIFGNTKDPIVRLFFGESGTTNNDLLKKYLDQTANM